MEILNRLAKIARKSALEQSCEQGKEN